MTGPVELYWKDVEGVGSTPSTSFQ